MFIMHIASHTFSEVHFLQLGFVNWFIACLLHRITNAVKDSGGLKERLFRTAYNAKRQALVNGKHIMKFIQVQCPIHPIFCLETI